MKIKYAAAVALCLSALAVFSGCMGMQDEKQPADSRGGGILSDPVKDSGRSEEENGGTPDKKTEPEEISAEKLAFINECEFPGIAGSAVGKVFDASFTNPRWYMQTAEELGERKDADGAEFPVFEGDCAHEGITTHVKLIFKLQNGRLSWHGAEIDGAKVKEADILGILSDCVKNDSEKSA